MTKDLDLVEPADIRFDVDGEFKFICIAGSMCCGLSRRSADFTWEAFAELDETTGSGDVDLGDDDILTIERFFNNGDEAVLKARR